MRCWGPGVVAQLVIVKQQHLPSNNCGTIHLIEGSQRRQGQQQQHPIPRQVTKTAPSRVTTKPIPTQSISTDYLYLHELS